MVSVHLTLVAGGKSGVADMESEARETETGAQKRREKMNKAWRERGVEREAQPGKRKKRINARGALKQGGRREGQGKRERI